MIVGTESARLITRSKQKPKEEMKMEDQEKGYCTNCMEEYFIPENASWEDEEMLPQCPGCQNYLEKLSEQ